MTTTSSSGDPIGRHLRPRDGGKKSMNTGGAADSDVAKMAANEEDAEMAAATTASHYLGCRGISSKRKLMDGLITIHNTPKKPRITLTPCETDSPNSKLGHELTDVYCWECHKECVENALDCVTCPRTFHPECLQSSANETIDTSTTWTCPVCTIIMKAECADTRSWAMQQVNVDQLCTLLGFALQRMKHPDSEAFHNPVPKSLLPDYYEIIFHPMDLGTLDRNIKRKMYASTEAFLEDAKWILHNSMIYNGTTSKYTADAKMILKICRHEMSEIELCPDCYMNSCIRKDNWFAEPCTYPHCLVWAKLKGFPFWPAKALRVSFTNNVDVRFFGAHDRAWIPIGQAFLLSEECPNPLKNIKKFGFDKAMEELHLHIEKLKNTSLGINFQYAPLKTEFKSEYLYNCQILFGNNLSQAKINSLVAALPSSSSFGQMDDHNRHLSGGSSNEPNEDLTETGNLFDSASSSFVQPEIVEAAVDVSSALQLIDQNEPKSPDTAQQQSAQNYLLLKPKLAKKQITRPAVSFGHVASSGHGNDLSVENSSASLNDVDVSTSPFTMAHSGEQKLSTEDEECISVFENIRLSLEDNSATEEDQQEAREGGESAEAQPGESLVGELQTLSASSDCPPSSASVAAILVQTDNEQKRDAQPSHVSSVAFTSANTCLTTVHKTVQAVSQSHHEHNVRKRSLQSVLARMHNNAQNTPPVNEIQSAAQRCFVSQANASTSLDNLSGEQSKLIEKYLLRISDVLSPTISSMLKEFKEISSNFDSLPKATQKDETPSQVESTNTQSHKMKWFYQEAIRAMKNTAKTTFSELQQAIEAEKNSTFDEQKRKWEEEKASAIKETKSKQWCANCGKEAVFYCCWNTSYCDYPCQQQHWSKHQSTCSQIRSSNNDYSLQQAAPTVITQAAGSFNTLSSSLQFTSNLPASAVNTAATNVVPVYAVPAAPGYYKASIPGCPTVALDLNAAAANGQFVAIQPARQPVSVRTTTYTCSVPPLNAVRKR